MSSKFFKVSFFILLLFTIFTRFFNLNWGNNYYFHPDENNMASSILQMDKNNLNPHFFAYGQFPLFLTFFTTPHHDFSTIILTLRFWSATFSSISVLFFYLIIKKFFNSKKIIFITTLIFIFTPGLIQLAHFGTTESILILVFLVNIYISLKLFSSFRIKYLYLASLISGLGLATKISSLIFTIPILLSLFFLFLKNKKFFKFIFLLILFFSLSLFIFIFFSPYNFLDFQSFRLSMNYEIQVATGQTQVFYTRQFINSIPYIFQFQKIFPYTIGVPNLFFSLFGLILLFKFRKHKINYQLLLVLIPVLIFFLYQGQLFTKWTRFISPVFFIFPFLSAFFISRIKNNLILFVLVFISVFPGILFFQRYFYPDIRVQASDWIVKNIPPKSNLLSESGNVINLPLKNSDLNVTNFDFYKLDQDSSYQDTLLKVINDSDYILIPSRRVFKNQNNSNFPQSQNYYQKLFSGDLGVTEIKTFSLNNSFLLNSESAEETWSVFDNPTIRIFKKNNL